MSKKTKTAKRVSKPSRTSLISFKSAATVRKRRNYIESLSPAKQEIANYFLLGYDQQDANKKFSSKKSLVTALVNEINSKGIYFRQLTPKTTSKSRKTTSKSK